MVSLNPYSVDVYQYHGDTPEYGIWSNRVECWMLFSFDRQELQDRVDELNREERELMRHGQNRL